MFSATFPFLIHLKLNCNNRVSFRTDISSKQKVVLLLSIIINLLIFNSVQANETKTDKPIKIILNDWTSQIVLSHITAGLFQEMGYSVAFSKKSTNAQWGALQRGLAHVQMEV